MTGAEIMGVLFLANQPLTAAVAEQAIKAGRLPDGVTLPSVLVRTVSLIDRQPLRRQGWIRSIARVSAMVRATSYEEQIGIIGLVRGIPLGAVGTIGTAQNVVVLTAGLGPDVIGPGDTFEQTQDFRVAFDGPA